ncbi:hypothetical protein ACJW30_04G014200 [Castanea mollissima]
MSSWSFQTTSSLVLLKCKVLFTIYVNIVECNICQNFANPFIIAPRKDVLRASTLITPKTEWITEEKFTYM